MNQLPDHKIIESILKRIYESNKLKIDLANNYSKHPEGYYTLLNPVTSPAIIATTATVSYSINKDELSETQKKLDMALIQTLHNLVDMYKESANPCILNEIELVLEDYIDSFCEGFE